MTKLDANDLARIREDARHKVDKAYQAATKALYAAQEAAEAARYADLAAAWAEYQTVRYGKPDPDQEADAKDTYIMRNQHAWETEDQAKEAASNVWTAYASKYGNPATITRPDV